MTDTHIEDERLVLLVAPGLPGDGRFDLRISTQYERELLDLLASDGLNCSRIWEFSQMPADLLGYGILVSPVVLPTLARILETILNRHKNKQFKASIGGKTIIANGYSHKEVCELLNAVAEEQQRQDEEWERFKRQ
jgi:hypothetical protein